MPKWNAAVLLLSIAILCFSQYSLVGYLTTLEEEEERQPANNRLYYVARFGLGHRLSKLSAAYHLASVLLDLPEIELHWGSCKTGDLDIFNFLFGTHKLTLRNTREAVDQRDKQVLVRNDVAGYYSGQSYKNAQVPLPIHYVDRSESSSNPWKQKMLLDRVLFQDLLNRFLKRTPEVVRFQEQVDWKTHTVIGLHVRAGNGEQDHFASSGRSVTDTSTFLRNVCLLLRKFTAENIHGPVLLFLATDTESVIPIVQSACNDSDDTRASDTVYPKIPVVIMSQPRVQASQGVSYHAWDQGKDCFQGWQASMMDMTLLTHSNVLVAGMRSTFTQILPRALVMDRGEPFCEVQETGRTMTCWDNEDSWLFRKPRGRTYSLDSAASPVTHKLLVHLPDLEPNPWIEKVQTFLKNKESSSVVFAYGERFDSKYRRKGQQFREDWTFDASRRRREV